MFDQKELLADLNRAYLVGVQTPRQPESEAPELLAELHELVENLGMVVAGSSLVALREPSPRFLIGSGKAAEIIEQARAAGAGIIVFDEALSPAQQRNWEAESKLAVIDRQEVILEVFAQRAQTREAVLQVALARMEYSLPRLKRAWTHLSRQRGGGTGARGQGETQLEEDRRLVKDRIAHLRTQIDDVIQQRDVQRRKRLRKPVPTAAIVGYTNAGKSSLLNRLTGAAVLAEDKLFATLDPTTRQLALPKNQRLLVTDTVGFIRRLPHGLVEAFKATLEEVVLADFLIHVLDLTSPDVEKHRQTTLAVLAELGAQDKPILTVYNKVDAAADPSLVMAARLQTPGALFLSARTGEGVAALLDRCVELVAEDAGEMKLLIPHERGDLLARLHSFGCVRSEESRDDGVLVRGSVPANLVAQFRPFLYLNGGAVPQAPTPTRVGSLRVVTETRTETTPKSSGTSRVSSE